MAAEASFCLFMSGSLPFGVPVANLALSLSPAGGTRGDLGYTRRPVRGVAG